jgi:S-adenosylhomocysteine hydrolase
MEGVETGKGIKALHLNSMAGRLPVLDILQLSDSDTEMTFENRHGNCHSEGSERGRITHDPE